MRNGILAQSATISNTFDLVIVFLFEIGRSERVCIIWKKNIIYKLKQITSV